MTRGIGDFQINKFISPPSKIVAMNLQRPQIIIFSYAFRFWLSIRSLLPKRRCHAFGIKNKGINSKVEKIYIINLNREPQRWMKMKQELKRILDSYGHELLNLAVRHVAVDASDFSQDPLKDAEIDPYYTLEDQLFVEPQPEVFPTDIELNTSIRMSRAECAIAKSHIEIWKQVAASDNEYALILEDDVWFDTNFANDMDKVWSEIELCRDIKDQFDILYLSYVEVKHGAPKTVLSRHLFRPIRGIWHLSGYVLSKKGAEKLLNLLPCQGPVDLWINHKFKTLNVLAAKRSLINQRRDTKSTNSYSILPSLTKIGAITSEGAALFNIRPTEQPVFVFGPEGSGLSSLAMALSMLGYSCCSDLKDLPDTEMGNLLKGSEDRIFNAYVNIGSLYTKLKELRAQYPKAKFILTTVNANIEDEGILKIKDSLIGTNYIILHLEELNKWRVVCQYLRCAPPSCSYPVIKDIGQRPILIRNDELATILKVPKRDSSPWVIDSRMSWEGIATAAIEDRPTNTEILVKITDRLEFHDTKLWHLRSDTFTDNLALFRPTNINFDTGIGAVLSVKKEPVAVRNYTAASISSQDQYLFGKFEAIMQVSNVPGVVTGLFLYRNSPRQEIDIEIAGNQPDRLLVNVFYNPGSEGANFDYGYRGSPTYINLGFDASKKMHRYAIEWSLNEIRWLVDDNVVHKRSIWNPTPIPHLPMTFHVNNWVSRSKQLAGRINNQRLPATTIVREITIAANKHVNTTHNFDSDIKFCPNNSNYSQSIQ